MYYLIIDTHHALKVLNVNTDLRSCVWPHTNICESVCYTQYPVSCPVQRDSKFIHLNCQSQGQQTNKSCALPSPHVTSFLRSILPNKHTHIQANTGHPTLPISGPNFTPWGEWVPALSTHLSLSIRKQLCCAVELYWMWITIQHRKLPDSQVYSGHTQPCVHFTLLA